MAERSKVVKVVVIVRGIPGSGKSYLVNAIKDILDESIVCSADDFFRVPDPVYPVASYEFDIAKLPQAHNACMAKFIDAIQENKQFILVDNTNTHFWEVENYIKLAHDNGYRISLLNCNPQTRSELKVCIERQTHDVPLSTILRLWYEFEPASEWGNWAMPIVTENRVWNMKKVHDLSDLGIG